MREARVPTAEEIERLSTDFRRNPASGAFVELGDAMLALGRPRDAVDIGTRGLRADPGSIPGRMMLSRAYVALHQWKEAQGELLRVVKLDRRHRDGFRLLGQVLMRRGDFDRALPVLQHAQNLDPADPTTLSMLKRARQGRPLDPPPGIPTPVAPVRAAPSRPVRSSAPSLARPATDDLDDEETQVAVSPLLADRGDPTVPDVRPLEDMFEPPDESASLARMKLKRERASAPPAPVERAARVVDSRGRDERASRPVQHYAPPPAEAPLTPDPDADPFESPAVALPTATAAAPARPAIESRLALSANPRPAPAVRPRVIDHHKPRDEARASLREAAAVGEDYLNHLLTRGLLEVPNVKPRASTSEAAGGDAWGRSSRRTFIALFVLLFLAVGGGVGWYLYDKQQRDEAVAAHVAAAQQQLRFASYKGLELAITECAAAIKRDRDAARPLEVYAESSALALLLYRSMRPPEVDTAIQAATRALGDDGAARSRELVFARAARSLATLAEAEDSIAELATVRAELAAWLEAHPDDGRMQWLAGMADLAAGDRSGARAAFDEVLDADERAVLARVSRADMLLDEGKYTEAQALYDTALAAAPGHPLALVGRSLARSERSADTAKAIEDLNVGLADEAGPRLESYQQLAYAQAHYVLEDYVSFTDDVNKAANEPPREPRFTARLALAFIAAGDVARAALARERVQWHTEEPTRNPLVSVLDAELLLARGLPDAAVEVLTDNDSLPARRVRARAMLDDGNAAGALEQLDLALEIAPDDRNAQIWRETARMITSRSERREADDALLKLVRSSQTKVARFAYGVAQRQTGDTRAARKAFEQSLEDITEELPNPLAYRAHTELAALDLAEGKLEGAVEHLKAALNQNRGYLPANGMMGRALMAAGQPATALDFLIEVVDTGVASAEEELAYAEAMVSGEGVTDDDRALAAAAVRRAVDKGAGAEELARVAPLVDPALAAELGVSPEPPERRRGR